MSDDDDDEPDELLSSSSSSSSSSSTPVDSSSGCTEAPTDEPSPPKVTLARCLLTLDSLGEVRKVRLSRAQAFRWNSDPD